MGSLLLRIWVVAGLTLSAYLSLRDSKPEPAEASTCPTASPGAPPRAVAVAQVSRESAVVSSDSRLERLASAESSEELCSLLGDLESSTDPQITYAISGVLERARLRSLRVCAVQALTRQSSSESTSFLVDLVEDEQSEVTLEALAGLASRDGELARATLIEAAHSENPELRLNAVQSLLRARRPESVALAEPLLSALPDSVALAELTQALGQSGDSRALGPLLRLLAQGDRLVHQRAIEALGTLADQAAVPTLSGLLAIGSEQEFRAAAEALRRIDEELAVVRLTELTRSENAGRRRLAAKALESFGAKATARTASLPLASSTEPAPDEAPGALIDAAAAGGEPELTTPLEAALNDEDPQTRLAATRSLVLAGQGQSERLLDGLLQSERGEDRSAGLELLAERGDPSSLTRLQALSVKFALDPDLDELDARAALEALKGVAPERAARALKEAFAQAEPERMALLLGSARGLGRLALPECLKGLESGSPFVVREAIELASELGDPRVAGKLLSIARDEQQDSSLRELAATALSALGGEYARALRSSQLGVGSSFSCRWGGS